MAGVLARKIHQLEPGRSIFEIVPLVDRLSDSNAEGRLRTILLIAFAKTAVSLAVIGLYGTASYLIALRRREIGLRIALGAVPGQIRAHFVKQATAVSLAGCLAGLTIAASLTQLLSGMLYGISGLDIITYTGVALTLLAASSIASALPASRAAQLNPVLVLKNE